MYFLSMTLKLFSQISQTNEMNEGEEGEKGGEKLA